MNDARAAEVASEVAPEVMVARAYLSRVAEPASIGLWRLVDELGPVDAMRALRAGRVPEALAQETAARRTSVDPEADLAAAERHEVRLLVPECGDWPSFAFAALERAVLPRAAAYAGPSYRRNESGEPVPPVALWVRGAGELVSLGIRSVGIVGSRAATSYGSHVTAELAYGLARQGVAVVSGGAYGIDAAAHRAALAAQGLTALVSAGGLDRPYPPGNATLYDRVAETGLLIAESPPGCAPHRRRFLTRNRLVAAFSTGVVVVEAAARSGATNTAGHCRALGRPLMAVPGPVTSAMSVGCHALLRHETDPALLVTSVDDVLAVVGSIGEGLGPRLVGGSGVRDELDRLDAGARSVFDGLHARRFSRVEEVAARSGVSPLEVVRALPTLDLAGLIETSAAGYRIAQRLRART